MTSQFGRETEAVPLPEHWEMRVDTRTGMPYYLNHLKQFTTWDDPRVVQDPRCMLNDMGSMTRGRSVSPIPSAARRRTNEDGSTSIPFNHHFLAPTKTHSEDQHTHSLPRPRRQNKPQPTFNRGALDGDGWFSTGFDEPENNFFSDPSWPIKSHSLRTRSHSPFDVGVEQLRRSPPRRGSPGRVLTSVNAQPTSQQNPVNIPIMTEFRDTSKPSAREQIIIPSQYKQGTVRDQSMKSRESPIPKLARQEREAELTSYENTPTNKEPAPQDNLHRTDSLYDNNPVVDDSQIPKLSHTVTNDNHQFCTSTEKAKDVTDADSVSAPNDANCNDKPDAHSASADVVTDADKSDEENNTLEEEKLLQANIDSSYKAIEKVRDEVDGYRKDVEEFMGEKKSKEFRYFDEMLTRCQLALDNVQTHGDVELRKKRKETVNHIDSLLLMLDNRCEPSTS